MKTLMIKQINTKRLYESVFLLMFVIIVFQSRDQNAGQNSNIQIGNKSSETVEECKYLGTTLTNQNSIYEEIKSRLKSGNACYHSVHNSLPVCYSKM
jgi:hypothetical protein